MSRYYPVESGHGDPDVSEEAEDSGLSWFGVLYGFLGLFVLVCLMFLVCTEMNNVPDFVSERRLLYEVDSDEFSVPFEVKQVIREKGVPVQYEIELDGTFETGDVLTVPEDIYYEYLDGYNHITVCIESVIFYVDESLLFVDFKGCHGYEYLRVAYPWDEAVQPFNSEDVTEIKGMLLEGKFTASSKDFSTRVDKIIHWRSTSAGAGAGVSVVS